MIPYGTIKTSSQTHLLMKSGWQPQGSLKLLRSRIRTHPLVLRQFLLTLFIINILIINIPQGSGKLEVFDFQHQETYEQFRKLFFAYYDVFNRLREYNNKTSMEKELTVCITGAAGQIAYSFIPQLLKGAVFPGVSIRLKMLDITPALGALKGVAMEIQDSTYPLLVSVEFSDKPEEMFKDVDVIVFLGGFPRKKGMERKDLLQMNKNIFKSQGQALSVAKPNVKCVVIANPANTNAKILSHYSKINPANITCLSRLDHNRAVSQIAEKTGAKLRDILGVYVFGNHSLTQYPCIKNITVGGKPIDEVVQRQWLENTFIPNVQKRGGEILNVKGTSSVFSAANAVIDHLKDWYEGTDGRVVSMGVISKGEYGIPQGLWTSLPVTCKNFEYEVVKGVELSQFCRLKIKETITELEQQVKDAELN